MGSLHQSDFMSVLCFDSDARIKDIPNSQYCTAEDIQ